MTKKKQIIACAAVALLVPVGIATAVVAGKEANVRPEGPCDVYADGGAPCVAAHSTTRALYRDYNGPLYQVMRQSDGKTLDIGVVPASATDGGGYADAAAQDDFCRDTYCWITILYDQSGKGNDLYQAPRGGFSGPAMGGFNNVPVADWAPVTLNGHKVYGIFIAPGMGLRWNDAHGTAVDDQAEGQYWVISGHHYNSGCCFDYGNAETDSRDDGDGTMETTYFGNQGAWYRGQAPGPWIMTDQENNLVGCVNPDPNDKYCADIPSVNWRFVTATADGEPHHWRSMGGNAQGGDLQIMYDGIRIQNPRNSYDPMRKQGAILLGNGGDNSNGSSGTFYEAAMTAPGTFPTIQTNQAIQKNVVAAGYDVHYLSISSPDKVEKPNGLQTFAPKQSQTVTVKFTNVTDAPISDLTLSIETPRRWKANVMGRKDKALKVNYTVEPGQSVVAQFTVKSAKKEFNGDLRAKATWTAKSGAMTQFAAQKVRNVQPVTINEFSLADGQGNQTNQFIELYNAGDKAAKIGGWTLTHHAQNMPYFSSITIPAGTKLAPKSFYLLGLATSGLAVQAEKGESTVWVRSITGLSEGDEIQIGGETRTIKSIIKPQAQAQPQQARGGFGGFGGGGAAPGASTTIWQPLPEGPVITIPAGSTNIPVTATAGFKAGDKMAIGYGATYPTVSNTVEKYEIVTVTEVGKPGTQAWLSMDAKKGDTNIKVSSTANITAGDRIRLDIDSEGHGIEWVTVKSVGTQSSRSTFDGPLGPNDNPGTGLELTEPLKFDHSSNMPFAVNGTGITFEPATKFDHSSNEPVLPLVYGLELDKALSQAHPINDVVNCAKVQTAGYQGCVKADQLFGGPALTGQGNMTLRTAKGLIADALNWGGVVDPWLSEGYHGDSGTNASGNHAAVPQAGGRGGFGGFGGMGAAQPAAQAWKSSGRYPDGNDSDDNRADFNVQTSSTIAAAAAKGSESLKVASTQGYSIGQTVYVGSGSNIEQVKIAVIGTPGYVALSEQAAAGAKSVKVASSQGFTVGQTYVLEGGQAKETVIVAEIKAAPRRGGFGGFGGGFGGFGGGFGGPRGGQQAQMPTDEIIFTAAISGTYPAGASLSGTGLMLAAPLKSDHQSGDPVAEFIPTPGAPNRY